MTKPTVFNYRDYEAALEQIERLERDNNNLRIRCRIAEQNVKELRAKLDHGKDGE